MALLDRRRRSLAIALHALPLVLLGASCALLHSLGSTKHYAFSHAVHVLGEKQECTSCHESFAVSDDPGMPSLDTCSTCHDSIDAKKDAEHKVASLFEGDRFRAARASHFGAEPIFSHKRHVKAKIACAACHSEIESNEEVDASVAVPMAKCSACHAERAIADDCATCHRDVRPTWAPPSHAHDWTKLHGRRVLAQSAATADDCRTCHEQSTCESCHKERAPDSHDAFFRGKGHGLEASMDRASCAVCHTEDSCSSCHANTPPSSHTGAFEGRRATHCLACHLPLKSEGCFTCHKSTPGHSKGAPKPRWHTPAMNCRQCHGYSAPLPHVDKGDDCNACHP
jgi:hypothetical protein